MANLKAYIAKAGQDKNTMNEMFSKLVKSSTLDNSLTLNWEGYIKDIGKQHGLVELCHLLPYN